MGGGDRNISIYFSSLKYYLKESMHTMVILLSKLTIQNQCLITELCVQQNSNSFALRVQYETVWKKKTVRDILRNFSTFMLLHLFATTSNAMSDYSLGVYMNFYMSSIQSFVHTCNNHFSFGMLPWILIVNYKMFT